MWSVCFVPTALRSLERNSIKERFRLQLRPNSRCIIVSLAESLRCLGVFFPESCPSAHPGRGCTGSFEWLEKRPTRIELRRHYWPLNAPPPSSPPTSPPPTSSGIRVGKVQMRGNLFPSLQNASEHKGTSLFS